MKIAAGTVVTLAYDLCDQSGEIIESSDLSGPITYMAGNVALLPGLDAKLAGLSAGDERDFVFPPEDAFGRPEDAPTKQLGRNEFPADAKLEKGLKFEAGTPDGQKIVLEVVDSDDAQVTVRMLHPLAGQKISMSVKVVAVREPTAAEKEAGRAISKPPPPPAPPKG
jgi:FKBP-type peptidyl-prolyl cis-trans isomerase SlyD